VRDETQRLRFDRRRRGPAKLLEQKDQSIEQVRRRYLQSIPSQTRFREHTTTGSRCGKFDHNLHRPILTESVHCCHRKLRGSGSVLGAQCDPTPQTQPRAMKFWRLIQTSKRLLFVMISANTTMAASYDYLQVALSALIAVSASYAALDLAGRVTAASGWPRFTWFTGGATAMGIGIWAMHFTAMLAFRLPVPVGYHWPTVILSLLAGILSSAFALYVASRQKMGWVQAFTSSVIMGVGIAAMHYMGMAAMRLAAVMRFNPLIVVSSVVLAMVFSLAALLLAFDLREETRGTPSRKVVSSLVMGTAISAMHYSGMASASFILAPKVQPQTNNRSSSAPAPVRPVCCS
jgi:NO-binding membrane sensor protein with MHYT domain